MKYSLVILAAAAGIVQASPFAFPVPQAVTAKISPTAPPPSGCTVSYSGTFGFAVMNVTSATGSQAVTTKSDGQPNASSGTLAPVSTISDGQPQATTGSASAVKTISDGQPQVSTGSASAIKTISDGQPQVSTGTASAIKTISDGQPQVSTGKPSSTSVMMMTGAPVMQISDGQIQGMMHTMTMMPVSQTGSTMTIYMMPVTTIVDGQPQAPAMPKPSTATASAIKTISDGQPQVSTGSASAIKTISDGQPQVSTGTASAIKTLSDGQPQASTGTASAVKTLSDGQPQASTAVSSAVSSASASAIPMVMVACQANSTLQVTLADSVLTDNIGRIGYIAANYQFQFDGPPQAGAIYTAGFSVCSNGSLALGGSAVFYQCLSGNFYNLYDRNWAPQCSPVTINVVKLVAC